MKHTKIVATVGPGVGSREKLRAFVEAGVDVFRINFSHGDEEQRGMFLQYIREVEYELGRVVAVYGDLCGPKIRIGMIADGEVELQAGRDIVIQRTPVDGTAEYISTTFPNWLM
jgi:pyruvate kinase